MARERVYRHDVRDDAAVPIGGSDGGPKPDAHAVNRCTSAVIAIKSRRTTLSSLTSLRACQAASSSDTHRRRDRYIGKRLGESGGQLRVNGCAQ